MNVLLGVLSAERAGGAGHAAARMGAAIGLPETGWRGSLPGAVLRASGTSAAESGIVAAVIGDLLWTDAELAGHARGRDPAGAVLEAWRRHGPALLDRTRGHFALAVLEPAGRRGLLAVDRSGVHELYWAELPGGGLGFASAARALLAHPEVPGGLDPQALYEYLFFHMVPGPRSIHAGLRRLGPAERLILEGGATRVETYWRPDFATASPGSLPALEAELRSVLAEGVARAASGARQPGCFLSGGLDSSTVAGMLARTGEGPPRTYSIGFDAEGYDETPYARLVARHFAANHHERYVTPADVLESVPRIAAAYDEPFGNSSALPAYLCARLAREDGVDRILAGDGGDELFAGNERYAKQLLFEPYGQLAPWLRTLAFDGPSRWMPDLPGLPVGHKVRRYVAQARVPLPDRLQAYNFLVQRAPEEVFEGDFLAEVDREAPLRALRARWHAVEGSAVDRMLHLDWKFTLADNDLRKVSATCALAGIEVAYPLLDDALVAFSCRIPARWKLRRRELRWFYRRAMRGFLPPETLAKRKHGFGLPFGVWTRTDPTLQALAYGAVERLGARGWFRQDFLAWAIDTHRQGHAGYWGELVWILMMLELWLESRPRAAAPEPPLFTPAAGSSVPA